MIWLTSEKRKDNAFPTVKGFAGQSLVACSEDLKLNYLAQLLSFPHMKSGVGL